MQFPRSAIGWCDRCLTLKLFGGALEKKILFTFAFANCYIALSDDTIYKDADMPESHPCEQRRQTRRMVDEAGVMHTECFVCVLTKRSLGV